MSVLPKTAHQFTDPLYWKNFFAQRKSPFEWYGDYESLSPVLEKYIKPLDKFLQLGCGNSELASQLYDNGFRSIHSVDVEQSVISDQIKRNKARTELTFSVDDAANIDCDDEEYTVVLDKGTLDALLPPNATDDQKQVVRDMFEEVHRVLLPNGRYLIVTLAQPHIIDFWVEYFYPKNQYILRTQKVENKASGFPMPVFVLIATKLTFRMPSVLPLEIWRGSATKAERVKNTTELKEGIMAEQETAQFIHYCSSKLKTEVSIDFQGEDPALGPRYRLCVLDNQECETFKTFAAFIVPNGRDAEWLFATPKGRQGLRVQCEHDRIVVVFLNRQHHYVGLDVVKSEIGHFISLLDIRQPPHNGNFDILSVGSVDVRKTLATGRSEINGDWSVEEVVVDEQPSRRLVFLNTMNLVQSEAFIKTTKKNKKVIDLDDLACEFHTMMLAGLALSPLQPLFAKDVPMKVAVLGLGGGLLASFVVRSFKKALVTGVELDPAVVKIASDYFSFPFSDSRVNIRCMDALEYLKETAKSEDESEKLDVIFVDVSGNQDAALQCPPPIFLTPEALENMSKSLSQKGMVSLNLVTRDDEVANGVKTEVAKHFQRVSYITSSEDVNEVLICQNKVSSKDPVPSKLANQVRNDIPTYDSIVKSIRRIRKF